MQAGMIGYQRALDLTLAVMPRLQSVEQPLADCCGHVLAQKVVSEVNVPAFATAAKDGYAVSAADIRKLARKRSLTLPCVGSIAAGSRENACLEAGSSIRLFTGAKIPEGTYAVIPEEWTTLEKDAIRIGSNCFSERNILAEGTEISIGTCLAKVGDLLTPAMLGLLAAAGCSRLQVYKRPRVFLIATGNEIVFPGAELSGSQIYASNLISLKALCLKHGIDAEMEIAKDEIGIIRQALEIAWQRADALITVGGSWKSRRDMVAAALSELKWKKIYHHIRLIPGKSAGLGILKSKPIFLLPGSPTANMVAFLLLALPGLKAMEGWYGDFMPTVSACLTRAVRGKPGWTRAVFGLYEADKNGGSFTPYSRKRKLRDMAAANAILVVDENTNQLPTGAQVLLNLV